MHDLFWRQQTGALGLVRGYGTNCMRERGPARVRIGCARRPQGLALRLTDLWQAEGGSQRGRSTRVGKLTEKRVRFGRRAPGLTFGTILTTSSASVAPAAAIQKVLAAVPRVPAKHGSAEPPHLALNRTSNDRNCAWRGTVSMRQFSGLAFCSPLHARALQNLEGRALKAMRSVGRFRGTLDPV